MNQPTTKLNDREFHVIAFIHGYLAQNGYPPTRRELQDALRYGRSPEVIELLVDSLEEKGWLWRVPNEDRNLRLWFQR